MSFRILSLSLSLSALTVCFDPSKCHFTSSLPLSEKLLNEAMMSVVGELSDACIKHVCISFHLCMYMYNKVALACTCIYARECMYYAYIHMYWNNPLCCDCTSESIQSPLMKRFKNELTSAAVSLIKAIVEKALQADTHQVSMKMWGYGDKSIGISKACCSKRDWLLILEISEGELEFWGGKKIGEHFTDL